jgi:hypothetical protein
MEFEMELPMEVQSEEVVPIEFEMKLSLEEQPKKAPPVRAAPMEWSCPWRSSMRMLPVEVATTEMAGRGQSLDQEQPSSRGHCSLPAGCRLL